VVEHCAQFTPTVGLAEHSPEDALLLDVRGMGRLFGSERQWGERLVEHFHHERLDVRLAIADTVGAAWAVARFHSAFLIRHSSLLRIPPGQTTAALRLLPIEALRLPERTLLLLHQLGIDLIDQLAALPRADLRSRFGPELLRRWDQALGRAPEPIRPYDPPTVFTTTWDFEPPTTRQATIDAGLEHTVERLTQMLHAAGRGAAWLTCRFDCLGDEGRINTVPLSVGLYRPTAGRAHLLGLLRLQMEQTKLSEPVMTVQLSADRTDLLPVRQQVLFPELSQRQSSSAKPELDALIDRLASRLGTDAVLGIQTVADAVPERSWRGRSLVDGKQRSRQKVPADLPLRPMRLFPNPIALGATAGLPSSVTTPPAEFHFAGRHHRVAHARGPERIETGWWRGRQVRRDYFQVETTDGRRLWLFRQRDDRRWFVHGAFG